MARIRALEWQTASFWESSIGNYISGQQSPQQALPARAVFVADENATVAGFVAGHLTRRYQCDGELQWINVDPNYRGRGIASLLIDTMLQWFRGQNAPRVCVDVDPRNESARRLYARHGAVPLNPHWMVWEDLRQPSLFKA
jgi:GNAT superfamily N-acetyltransferase